MIKYIANYQKNEINIIIVEFDIDGVMKKTDPTGLRDSKRNSLAEYEDNYYSSIVDSYEEAKKKMIEHWQAEREETTKTLYNINNEIEMWSKL